MYAVIKTGGKQHRVSVGEVLDIEKLDEAVGAKVYFSEVLMLKQDETTLIGQPYINGALVSAEILSQERAKKVKIIKFKRRKHQMKHQGHRQYVTKIKITDIQAPKEDN
jgi:large subunit ribosomal protein L21